MKNAVEVFNDWSKNGKDEGMEENHTSSVEEMLHFSLTNQKKSFTFIDAGCGNGWTVRRVAKHPLCVSATGIDSAEGMIFKAKSLDPKGKYILSDLFEWKPKLTVDLVHSMEVFYYVEDPIRLINHVTKKWLSEVGRLIIGVDFYRENKPSLSWVTECGISLMTLLSEKEWSEAFKMAGLKKVSSWRYGAKEKWAGTLIITGKKF